MLLIHFVECFFYSYDYFWCIFSVEITCRIFYILFPGISVLDWFWWGWIVQWKSICDFIMVLFVHIFKILILAYEVLIWFDINYGTPFVQNLKKKTLRNFWFSYSLFTKKVGLYSFGFSFMFGDVQPYLVVLERSFSKCQTKSKTPTSSNIYVIMYFVCRNIKNKIKISFYVDLNSKWVL